MVTAAVVVEPGAPFELAEIELDDLRPDEVRVRIHASGMCHTDLAVRAGHTPAPLPAVLGHEGAGEIEEVGPSVTSLAVGDRVVLSFDSCGACLRCRTGRTVQCEHWMQLNFFGGARLDGSSTMRAASGDPLHGHFFGQSSFASHVVCSERSVVKIVSESADWATLAPLGCGIQTGAGSILNVLCPQPGSTVAIYGAGAVGLAGVLAAQLTAAGQVIVVDRIPGRLALAASIGATATVEAGRGPVAEAILELTDGRGADVALEATGSTDVLRTAVDALAVGGRCGVVGAPPVGSEVALDVTAMLVRNPSIIGINQGLSVPQQLIPALVALHDRGRFPLDRLITAFPFDAINDAAAAALAGAAVKPVLIMN
jgi:aryl-alcohol dehydrogenase